MSCTQPSPIRKRPRLSLKAMKKSAGEKTPPDKKPPDISMKSETDTGAANTSPGKIIPASPDAVILIEEIHQGPGVAGFENLGNTCFLNSVLQVLRYTPGFLEGLDTVSKEINRTEKLKKEINEVLKKEQGDDFEEPDDILSWQVVKVLHRLFNQMEIREMKYRELGSSAVATMAIKPERLLDIIRRLNPMFEGYLQHDAQELLRCLLCYLQDAWKEICKIKASHKRLEMKKNPPDCKVGSCNILNYFGKSNRDNNPNFMKFIRKSPDKTALFQEWDLLNSIDKMETTGSDQIKGEITECSANSGIDNQKACNGANSVKRCGRSSNGVCVTNGSPSRDSVLSCDEVDCLSIENKLVDSLSTCRVMPEMEDQSPVVEVGGRRRSCRSSCMPSPVTSVNIADRFTPTTASGRRSGKKRKTSLEKFAEIPSNGAIKSASPLSEKSPKQNGHMEGSKAQPSVLSLFGRKEAGCKRLGMRGAVVAKIHSGHEAPEILHSKHVQETASTGIIPRSPNSKQDASTVITRESFDAPSMDSMDESPQDILQVAAEVKPVELTSPSRLANDLEKLQATSPCMPKRSAGVMEHVSESSLRSAALQDIKQAKVKLENCDPVCDSPLKSVNAQEAMKVLGSPAKKQKDFVEHLFQGMMMLRTRCMECEFSRERREIFQDVSVPLKNSACGTDADQENDTEDEADEASLSRLMSAFTDVERLCDENKYFCENCYHYVEAERSLHYETLPEVLTLHLKRFSATSGYFGTLTKINDHVATPLYLPCLRYMCPRPCNRSDHRYKLYAVITHSGMSITSGHYMSYVKWLSDSKPAKILTMNANGGGKKLKVNKGPPESGKKKGRKSIISKSNASTGKDKDDMLSSSASVLQCATGNAHGDAALPQDAALPPDAPSLPQEGTSTPDLTESSKVESMYLDYIDKWLECDDDYVQVLHDEDFDRRLAPDSGYGGTPYVLFYRKDYDRL